MSILQNDARERNTEEKQPHEKPADIGEALENVIYYAGSMGTYQSLLFIGMLPFGVSWAFVYFGQMFITATPQEHWCRVPELAGLDIELRRNLSVPFDGMNYDHCNMFDANWKEVLETLQPPDPGTPIIPCQHGWEFIYDDIPYSTVVSEREWVCGRASYVPIAQAINFAGSIVGGVLCGVLADKFGRLAVLVLANLLACLGGITTIFTSGFWDFAMCRFIVGMSCDSLFLLIYILALEYVGIKHRTWVANLSIAFYFGLGCIIQPWIALWINDWRYFSLAISLPPLFVLLAPWLLLESTRWLVSKGQIEKAVNTLKRLERINKSKIPESVMDDFVSTAKTTEDKEESVGVLFSTPSLRIMMGCLIVAFMSVAVIFDGLIRLSENLGLDFFVTFTISAATEVPSIALLVVLLDRFGRRNLVCFPIVTAGVIAFVAGFVPRGIASVSLAVIARFFTNMSYGAVIQWTPELLPTAVRASGASFVHLSAFAAIMLSPFIVYSENAWEPLPLILISAIAVAGGMVALLLPETAGRPMPQTMDDWNNLALTKPFQRKRKNTTSAERPGDIELRS